MPLPFKKPKSLKRKNIKRRTGARSQSKQIAALSTQLNKIQKINFSRIRTCWQKGNQTINMPPSQAGVIPYMIPIPYAPCIITGTDPETVRLARWQDNNLSSQRVIDQNGYGKRFVFGVPDAALNSNLGYHTGGTLKYQMILQGTFSEATARFQKVGLFLIKPKRALADQLTRDKKLIARAPIALAPILAYPGGQARLDIDKDYLVHSGVSSDGDMTTYFGSAINTKYWTVVSSRQVAFSHPGASGAQGNVSANNSTPANNAFTASGTMRLPAGGILKNASPQVNVLPGETTSAVLNMSIDDQKNENSCYLVAVHNIPQDQAQIRNGLSMGLLVEDHYKIVV